MARRDDHARSTPSHEEIAQDIDRQAAPEAMIVLRELSIRRLKDGISADTPRSRRRSAGSTSTRLH
jgi:hypothetical protein